MSVVARRIIVHADDAVRRARNVCRKQRVGAGIIGKLLRSETTGLNEADAGALNVVKTADSG